MSSEESVNLISPYCAIRKTPVCVNECKQHFKRFLQIPRLKNAGELLKAMKKQSVRGFGVVSNLTAAVSGRSGEAPTD